MSAYAVFDCLYLIDTADASSGLSVAELQILDYLACLMSVYDGRRAEEWGVGFSVTDLGAPFSTDLEGATRSCERTGWINRADRVLHLSERGVAELVFQKSLAPNHDRARFLDASVSASLSMTLPSITDALNQEPGLNRAMAYLRRKRLLDETSLELLDEQFEYLRTAVGGGASRDNLVVPTAVWLAYLANSPSRAGRRE